MALRASRWLAIISNLSLRALIGYFAAEALYGTLTDADDPRFAGKGIALRNALLIAGFSLLLPGLHRASRRKEVFPWAADAILISIPALDMAGNSLDLYRRSKSFDVLAHFYGTTATAALFSLALAGRRSGSVVTRWMGAAGGSTLFHVLLEVQEYWTDVIFGTRNVFSLEDTEGDILAGVCGAIAGASLVQLAFQGPVRNVVESEAVRLAAAMEMID